MHIFVNIFTNSIVPIFLLIALGFAIDKKFKLDTNTLTKMTFYIFVPAFMFVNIYSTDISLDLVWVVVLTITLLAVNFLFGMGLGRVLRLTYKTRKAFENSVMFHNCGNVGVSLITLVFTGAYFIVDGETPYLELALSVQVMTLMVQNLFMNTFGFINSGGEGMNFKKGTLQVLKMPAIYAVIFAISLKFIPYDITPTPVFSSLTILRLGMIPVSLVTLGAQLAKTQLNFKLKTPYISAFCRLLVAPAFAYVLIQLFGFEGIIAQAIFIGSSTPTAINSALLSIETKGYVDFAVQTVTVSTLFSAITMTAVVYLAILLF